MEGKIFSESANIYQDQAKVLYEYYKAAAEKIVSEEKVLEAKIKDAQYQVTKMDADLGKASSAKTAGIVLLAIGILAAAAGLILPAALNPETVSGQLMALCKGALLVGGAMAVIGLILLLTQGSKVKKFQAMLSEKKAEIARYKEAHKNIFRDYKVTKMGVAYVPVAKRIAYNGKSFVVDQSGIAKEEKFTLQVIRENELINEAVTDLQELTKSAPIVENSKEPENISTGEMSTSIQNVRFNDYFGKMDRTLRTISYSLGNVEESSVELPVVFPDTPYADFLKEHSTSDVSGSPVFNVFDTTRYEGAIDKFNLLNETRRALSSQSEQVDQVLKTLMVDMAEAVQSTAARKIASAGSLVDYSNRILFNILKAPYNFYSPVLEAEEIERIRNEKFDYESMDYNYKPFNLRESSKVKLDLRSMSWVAEDGSRTTVPFGMSQIQSEIIAPIVSNLLKDTRKERMEIYNHIKDQKMSYLNKWHQDTEDFYGRNRAEAADIINLMRSTLSEYSAAYNTLSAYKKTESSMAMSGSLESAVTETTDNTAEVLAGYQAQSQQVMQTQQEFTEYMERLHEDIDIRAEKFGYVEYFDASLRDKKSKEAAVAAQNVSHLEDRRKPLAEVNPLLAQNSDLPPVPDVDALAYEYAGMNLNAMAQEALEELEEAAKEPVVTDEEIVDQVMQDILADEEAAEAVEEFVKAAMEEDEEMSEEEETDEEAADEEYDEDDCEGEDEEYDEDEEYEEEDGEYEEEEVIEYEEEDNEEEK